MTNFDSSTFLQLSEQISATCFLNSLLREWDQYEAFHLSGGQSEIHISIEPEGKIILPLLRFSMLGRHQYSGEYFLLTKNHKQQIAFSELVDRISGHLAKIFVTDQKQLQNFKNRVFSSQNNVFEMLKRRKEEVQYFENANFDFKNSEQALFVGHNFHPTPKSRDEFTEQDMQRYSPEWGGQFSLVWLIASPQIIYQMQAESFAKEQANANTHWSVELAEMDLGSGNVELKRYLQKAWVPFPMHPWQYEVLKKQAVIQKYFADGLLVELSTEHGQPLKWSPTSSLRSVYCEQAHYMLKYSMSVKLTNSIRHLLPKEVERGLQLRDVLHTAKGKEFLARYPDFHIITEPAYMCLKDKKGERMESALVVCRENPFQSGAHQNKVVLAALAQDAIFSKENTLQKLILNSKSLAKLTNKEKAQTWFAAYLKTVVEPLVIAQANYGIILGAHQQNLVLDIKDGLPIAAYFRDCQGTGYSELGYDFYAKDVASIYRENGNVINEKMTEYLFIYYLILNSTFNVITAITSLDWITEEDLILELKEFLKNISLSEVKDRSCLDVLLGYKKNSSGKHAELMHKGNFICAFRSLNENTTPDPLVIYTPVKNPMVESSVESILNERPQYV